MIFKTIRYILFIFLLGFNLAYSQEKATNPEEIKLEEKAFALFKEEKYSEALPLMSQLLSMYPKEANYNFGYAVCLIETNQQTEKAIKYLQYADSKSQNPLIKYYLGRAYHLNYKFEEALSNYTLYKSAATPADQKKYFIDNLISMCNNGKELIRFISDLTVVDNKKIKNENYYYSYELKDFGGKLIVKPPEFKSKIDKKLEPSNTVIFLPSNTNEVYYGSYGDKNINGRDIYKIKKDSLGKWGKPVNIGATINTSFDEDFAFLKANGKTLFFSSKGHNSMGGYDIFRSEFDSVKSTWTKPVNLDFPINTPYDDYLFVPDKDELYAFFTSNRETNGDKISVYKIIIDKQPVERQFDNLEEIINTSKLEVSPLADIKRVEDSRTDVNKNPILAQNTNLTNNTNSINNKFTPLTYTPQITNEQISSEIVKDEEAIKNQSSDIRKQSNLAYIAANEKNKEANEKRKLASDKTDELNKITDQAEQEKKKQEVYDLITDAENTEREAVTAFNMAKNLDQVATEMEKDASKTKNLLEAISTSGNNNNESIVEAVNKNKERLNNSQNKYTSIENEITNKNKLSADKQIEFSQIEKEYQANLNEVSNIEDEVNTLKQQIDNETDNTKKTSLLNELKVKNNTLEQTLLKDSILENKYEKSKYEKESLVTEVNFLKNLKNKVETDKTSAESLASITKNIDKEQLHKDVFNKELTADIKTTNTVNKNPEIKNTNIIAQNNNQTNNNIIANNTHQENNNSNKNIYKSSPVFPFSSDTGDNNLKVVAYQKEVLNSQYYMSLSREQEKQLDVLNNSLANISDSNTRSSVEKQIKNLTADLDNNKEYAIQSSIRADKLRKEAISQIDTAVVTNEQLVLNASQYKSVNKIPLENDQKQILSLVQNDHEYLKGVQKNYQEITTEINDLEKKRQTSDAKTQKIIDKELVDKRIKQKEIITKFATVTKESNQDESNIYSDLIEKNREINVTNPNLRYANMLEKESEIYFEKASNVRKDADLHENPEEIKLEYQKADNIEQIAIQKQKYALDLYLANKTTATSNNIPSNNTTNNNTSNIKPVNNNQNVSIPTDSNLVNRTTEITLNADEEQQLKTYRLETHKSEVLIEQAKKDLAEVETKQNQAATVFSTTEKKQILKGVDQKKIKAQDMMLNAYQNYGKADSMKYMLYKNQIAGFENSSKTIENNKVIARQYTQEADFYFSEAAKIRKQASVLADKNEKTNELMRATEFEKKALTSQELAVDILTDINPVSFVSANDLTKIDRLDVLNQAVDVSEIVRIKTNRIISKINPTEEELKILDEAEKKRSISNQLITDASNYKVTIDSLNNIISKSTSEKNRKKAQKQIPKLEKKMFASQFTSAEVNESINDARFYLYKGYFAKNRLNENTTEARQGKQLEKDANSKYSKAKSLRENAFMKEDARKAYDMVVQAEKLEATAIEDQERAYGVYLKLKPLEDEIKEYAETHKQQINNENPLIIKSTADITHIETPIDTTTEVIASNNLNNNPDNNNNNTIVENTSLPVDTNHVTNNQIATTDTNKTQNPVDTLANKNITVENTSNNNNSNQRIVTPVDTLANKNLTVENTSNNNNNSNQRTVNPVDTTTTKPLIADNNNNNNQNTSISNVTNPVNNNTSNPDITAALNKEGYGFSFLPVNAYSNAHPIPMNPPLPDGLVFKVQIGAFKAPVKNEAFKGLNPVCGETMAGSAYVRYYVGLFYSEDAANLVKNQIKPFGYNDAFIVAYYNGKRISLFEARRLLKESTSQENYNLLAQAEVEKIKNRVVNQPVNNQGNIQNQGNNKATTDVAPVNSTNVNQTAELFYTVQIGVYKNPVTANDLKNLSPIYEDNAYGFIRYTTGKFSDSKKAEIEKNRIVQLGITDAFVSAYYKGKKITLNEAANIEKQNQGKTQNDVNVTYPEQSIPTNQNTVNQPVNKEDIVFKIQIGAFKEQIPVDKVNDFIDVAANHGLDQENDASGSVIYSVGKIKKYEEAVKLRDVLINEGFKDAFIIAYNGKQKISVNEAKSLLNQ